MLENNYILKMMYSPDYKGVDTEAALAVSLWLRQPGGVEGWGEAALARSPPPLGEAGETARRA